MKEMEFGNGVSGKLGKAFIWTVSNTVKVVLNAFVYFVVYPIAYLVLVPLGYIGGYVCGTVSRLWERRKYQ